MLKEPKPGLRLKKGCRNNMLDVFLLITHCIQLVPPIYSLVWGLSLEHGQSAKGQTLKRNRLFLLLRHSSVVHSSSAGGGACEPRPGPCQTVDPLDLVQVLGNHSCCAFESAASQSHPEDIALPRSSPTPGSSYISVPHLPPYPLSPGGSWGVE